MRIGHHIYISPINKINENRIDVVLFYRGMKGISAEFV